MAVKPSSGLMIIWKPKGSIYWNFGYVTYLKTSNLIRLGRWNGDDMGGVVIDPNDIEEWREYKR